LELSLEAAFANFRSTNGKIRLVRRRANSEIQRVNIDDRHCETCPLSRVQAGVAVRIKQICAAPEVQNRLREIGLGEEQIVRLITSQANFICQVCNARMAISAQLAQLILVEPLVAPARVSHA
jgi:Fe2+ transport system protein FeoA